MSADLEFVDSFMHYDTASCGAKYENPGSGTLVPGAGRFGVQGYVVGGGQAGPAITFKRNLETAFTGAAIKIDAYGDSGRPIIDLSNNGVFYARVRVDQFGKFTLTLGDNSFLTVGNVMNVDTFYYVELEGIINTVDETLTAVMRVDNIALAVLATASPGAYHTIVDTDGAFFTQAQTQAFSPPLHSGVTSDFYAHSTRFMGNQRIRFIRPDAPGFYNDFGIVGPFSTAWEATREVPPDGDTSYIWSTTPLSISPPVAGQRTSCNMEAVDLLGGVCQGIQFLVYTAKDNANVRAVTPFVRNGSTDTSGAELSIPSTGYVYTHDCQDVNPTTGLPYTKPELDAIQLGVWLTK